MQIGGIEPSRVLPRSKIFVSKWLVLIVKGKTDFKYLQEKTVTERCDGHE